MLLSRYGTKIAIGLAWLLVAAGARGETPAEKPTLVSGEPIPVRTEGGLGVLATPNAYKTFPIGSAKVFGDQRPDVFVRASHGLDCALYLYRWVRDTEQGVPVFAPPVKVKHFFKGRCTPDGTIFEDREGAIRGLWIDGAKLVQGELDRATQTFRKTGELGFPKLPSRPSTVGVIEIGPDWLDLVVASSNGARYRPAGDTTTDDYVLYDGKGAFRGQWPRAILYRFRVAADLSKVQTEPKRIGDEDDEILGGITPLATIDFDGKQTRHIVAASLLGNLHYFGRRADKPDRFNDKLLLADRAGRAIRHPTHSACAIGYQNRDGQLVDLLVGGEGALYYYHYTGCKDEAGRPIYEEPEPARLEDTQIFAGTLATPNAVDWNGDGATDLVVGNSEGKVLLFKNEGDNRNPRFGLSEELKANGRPIHVQPGYYGIQGPFESRWGYTCPTTADWNGDGLPDLLLSSATARHDVLLNVGSKNNPRLTWPTPLYLEGLELHGVWRVKPGVATVEGRTMYVIQDDGDAFHLYWRVDDFNVKDGGHLHLQDGRTITSYITGPGTRPGQKGRCKIQVVDWDGDGKLDLVVGTVKHASIPVPNTGLPWFRLSRGERSLQVVFLRNTGTNTAPVYEYPRQFQFRGEDVYFGAHSNSPTVCDLGDTSGGPNLLLGVESGRIIYFEHRDLTLREAPEN